MINTVLFDLDGTLLPMDQDAFLKVYFSELGKRMGKKGYDPYDLMKWVYEGTKLMVANEGKKTNEEVFWEYFMKNVAGEELIVKKEFMEFYEEDFDKIRVSAKCNEFSKKCVDELKQKGYNIVLATNPLFPSIATYKRIVWAGLNVEDFSFITTYENSSYAKPNIKYFESLLKKIDKKPYECIMIGNDASDDMVVEELNVQTYLVKNSMINEKNIDISKYRQGTLEELYEYILELPSLN